MDEWGFIIAACLTTEDHFEYFTRCIESVHRLHPEQKIVVILSCASNPVYSKRAVYAFENIVHFETETGSIPADFQVYQFLKRNRYFNKAVIMQDSMQLLKQIDDIVANVKDIQFLWYFTNHRVDWHTIIEPDTAFNRNHKIVTHDDLNLYIINNVAENAAFREYCNGIYNRKSEWCGCFGSCSIITLDFLEKMDSLTNIIDIQTKAAYSVDPDGPMSTNRIRRSLESIFSLACQYTTRRPMEGTAIDGLYYDGISYHNNMSGLYIAKKTFNR
jgi:hypothetical protein